MSVGRWTEHAEIADSTPEPPASGPMYMGFDAGGNRAMTAVVCYWPRTGRLRALGGWPQKPSLEVREREDAIHSGLYRAMEKRGELMLIGEHHTDVGDFLKAAVDRYGVPYRIILDNYRRPEVTAALRDHNIPSQIVTYNAGFRRGEEDIRALHKRVLNGQVRARKSVLLRYGLSGATVVCDSMKNRRLGVRSDGLRRREHRDDSIAALLVAVGEAERDERNPRRSRSIPVPAHLVMDRIERKRLYNSARWRVLAPRLKREAGWRCQDCGILTGSLEVHHKAGYKDFFDESMLIVLCRECHQRVHKTPRQQDRVAAERVPVRDDWRDAVLELVD